MIHFVVFTTKSFLSRANVCKKSIEEFHPEAKLHFIILEDNILDGNYVPNLAKRRLEYARELLKDNHDRVIIMGADCVLYNNINDFIWMDEHIGLIPHVLDPPKRNGAQLYRTGHANADLMLFTKNALPILDWLIQQDMVDKSNEGIFYEQTWISILPFVYDSVGVNRNPGINFAYFNFHERQLTKQNNKYYVDGYPLSMVQYSGYIKGQPEKISRYHGVKETNQLVLELFKEYENRIVSN